MLNRILLVMALALMSVPAAAADTDPYYGGFDGRWEGELKAIAPDAYDAEHGLGNADVPRHFAIQIQGGAVRVYGNADNEIKPGLFQIIYDKTNAVIAAINSSGDADRNGWVETWNFSLTHKDENTVYVIWTRMVNNYAHPYDYREGNVQGRFFIIATGELSRVPKP